MSIADRTRVRKVTAAVVALSVIGVGAGLAKQPKRYEVKESTPAGATPHFPAFDPESGNVLVSNVAAGTVTEVVPGEGPVRVFSAGIETHTVVVNEEERRAYAVNKGAATVSVLDLETGETITSFPVGPQPHGIALDDRRDRLYVTSIGADRLDAFSLDAFELVGSVVVGDGPWGVDVRGDSIIVADTGGTTLHLIDADDLSVRSVVEVGQGPWNVKIGKSGAVYATLERSGEVVAVGEEGEILWRTPVGAAPHGLVVDEDRRVVLAAVTGADQIAVLDSRTGRLLQSLEVADAPAGMTYDFKTGRAFAGAQGAGMVVTLVGSRAKHHQDK